MISRASSTFEQARRRMIETQLRARGITDAATLQAMERVPRERFLPLEQVDQAYEDRALAIGFDQTISQPYIVALMTQALKVSREHRVLEVGTGSGYQTAILAELAGRVYTIDRIAALSRRARRRLRELGYDNVEFRVGDGTLGWPEQGPFDRILVTAGAPKVPEPLLEQLADGGRLVIPVGGTEHQTLICVQRLGDRTIEEPLIPCRFVKLIGQEGWQAGS